jgi:hypothetical protein
MEDSTFTQRFRTDEVHAVWREPDLKVKFWSKQLCLFILYC